MNRYMIIIRAPQGAIDPTNMQWVVKQLEKLTKSKVRTLFSTKGGDFAGLQVDTDRRPGELVNKVSETFNFTNGGFAMAVEMGEQFSSIGNSAGFRHLQH